MSFLLVYKISLLSNITFSLIKWTLYEDIYKKWSKLISSCSLTPVRDFPSQSYKDPLLYLLNYFDTSSHSSERKSESTFSFLVHLGMNTRYPLRYELFLSGIVFFCFKITPSLNIINLCVGFELGPFESRWVRFWCIWS